MLSISDLSVAFKTRRGEVNAVKGISFDLANGERLGIVGESGSGKSVTSYALMRILDAGGHIKAGAATYGGIDLRNAAERDMRDIRGREISMIFQNPRAALNPIRKVGHQIEDVLRQHSRATRHDAKQKAIAALEAVKIRDAAARYEAYPFELSGGMCQRIVIAIALACDPKLLIADEPTTGLDITTQKAVMDLVNDLVTSRGMSSILITHDLGLASQYCDRIVVMKDGLIVEQGDPVRLFTKPGHPYTRKLMDATPRRGVSIRSLLPEEDRKPLAPHTVKDMPLIEVKNLVKTYDGKSGPVHAVKDVSFTIREGQSVGLVGESGCGKSTTSSMLVRLLDSTSGEILYRGQDLAKIPSAGFARHPLRSKIQMVFQDATDSLNPRHSARMSIAEPLKRMGKMEASALSARVEELATLVGLPVHLLDRFPHQLSGGQKARVGIARAIAPDPDFLILDEPTAALDVSIQAVVLNLLADLRARLGISYLFVSHDLNVVRLLCDQVIVMRAGEVVEIGPAEQVMDNPQHDYTKELLSAAPQAPKRKSAA
ncbi:dipeptide ABC transporter ATP-binding protein [Pelagibacterium halotolerans]|uniref:Nickel import system ATP-binding protein NikD n=1 Tax=Pelagibacterium halotolerans (strain DSM 22347 / JCM 15775 / CGMCC 1.7692 / B2) TaxID=1082931 RepID=G4REN3_PELHB|nr:ABC transporter ATP-binding protein [Pelagibacterium halotolerans]AEQ50883.1 dipeptide transport ATP-binding protein DppD [Pelagibacterium halotolerans B2]QJR19210.1 ABC transporter ATP-binding protein [Pelagibacterium halotolerans]SDZ98918.1 peptide/nickel transport system ATP-binding protein [Pelagibacterium halotolerans]